MAIVIERKFVPWVAGAAVLAGATAVQTLIQVVINASMVSPAQTSPSGAWAPNPYTARGRKAAEIMASYGNFVDESANARGIPQKLVVAVIINESNGVPTKRGADGEYGLMQLMPGTAREMGFSGDFSGLFDPRTNIGLGTGYLAKMYAGEGNWFDTLRAYNGGPKWRRSLKAQGMTLVYADKVSAILAQI